MELFFYDQPIIALIKQYQQDKVMIALQDIC